MKFDREKFKNGMLAIRCHSEHEAQQCIKFLYEQGFAWARVTPFDDTVTQWAAKHNEVDSIIYYSCNDRDEEPFFWMDDYRYDENIHPSVVYDFYQFVDVQINITPENLLELLGV